MATKAIANAAPRTDEQETRRGKELSVCPLDFARTPAGPVPEARGELDQQESDAGDQNNPHGRALGGDQRICGSGEPAAAWQDPKDGTAQSDARAKRRTGSQDLQ